MDWILESYSSVYFFVVLGGPIPPKTLNEAGTMAICHSAAWDAKVRNHVLVIHLGCKI